jgi:carbohydrate kinase (thermoresistant glucokinase family)
MSESKNAASEPTIVVMGVSGCGKSAVGARLAQSLAINFIDGDDLHTERSIAKMSLGVPLDDLDRQPWLEKVGRTLRSSDSHGLVVACSALRRSYRTTIRKEAPSVVFIHLDGSRELIGARMRERLSHFMPESLLDSQFGALEPLDIDERGAAFEIETSIDAIARQIADWLASAQ